MNKLLHPRHQSLKRADEEAERWIRSTRAADQDFSAIFSCLVPITFTLVIGFPLERQVEATLEERSTRGLSSFGALGRMCGSHVV